MKFSIHKLDQKLHKRPYIASYDKCYYLLEKKSEGYSASEANNLIFNFKKPLSRKAYPDWEYKQKAMDEIARMLEQINFTKKCIVIPAPTSKPRNSKDWDNRIDYIVSKITHKNTLIVKALEIKTATVPSHRGGSRNLQEIKENTICKDLENYKSYTNVIIVDDVLTTGAHFKAWKELLLEKYPHIKSVEGLFVALHIWENEYLL